MAMSPPAQTSPASTIASKPSKRTAAPPAGRQPPHKAPNPLAEAATHGPRSCASSPPPPTPSRRSRRCPTTPARALQQGRHRRRRVDSRSISSCCDPLHGKWLAMRPKSLRDGPTRHRRPARPEGKWLEHSTSREPDTGVAIRVYIGPDRPRAEGAIRAAIKRMARATEELRSDIAIDATVRDGVTSSNWTELITLSLETARGTVVEHHSAALRAAGFAVDDLRRDNELATMRTRPPATPRPRWRKGNKDRAEPPPRHGLGESLVIANWHAHELVTHDMPLRRRRCAAVQQVAPYAVVIFLQSISSSERRSRCLPARARRQRRRSVKSQSGAPSSLRLRVPRICTITSCNGPFANTSTTFFLLGGDWNFHDTDEPPLLSAQGRPIQTLELRPRPLWLASIDNVTEVSQPAPFFARSVKPPDRPPETTNSAILPLLHTNFPPAAIVDLAIHMAMSADCPLPRVRCPTTSRSSSRCARATTTCDGRSPTAALGVPRQGIRHLRWRTNATRPAAGTSRR